MKVPSIYKHIDKKSIGWSPAPRKAVINIFERAIPKLMRTKSPKEGLKILYKEIESELATTTGGKSLELSDKVWDEIRRNTKVEYKNGRGCVTYRKFKKCMKIDRK
jgi:hypothetical protein